MDGELGHPGNAPLHADARPLVGDPTRPPRRRGRRRVRVLVTVAVGVSAITMVALFAYYRATQGLGVRESFLAVDPRFVAAALLLHMAAHLAWAGRLWTIAHGLGEPPTYPRAFLITTAGVFGAAVTPARVGGDGLRLYLLRHHTRTRGMATKLLAADRALDIVFFLLAGLGASLLLPSLFADQAGLVGLLVLPAMVLFAALLVAVVALVVLPRPLWFVLQGYRGLLAKRLPRAAIASSGFLARLGATVRAGLLTLLTERKGWLTLACLLTVATWALEFSILKVLLAGFGHPEASFLLVLSAAVLVNLATTIPLTPGGSGVAEVAALALLSQVVAGPEPLTPAFVLVWRAITYYYDLLVGGLVAARVTRPAGPDAAPAL